MLKILIAEDNLILADILEESLLDGGYEVCGIAYTVGEAAALANRHKPDIAILDYRLAEGGYGSQIRPLLHDADKMGILYVSADYLNDILTKADGDAYILKPYSINHLLAAVRIVHAIKLGGQASPAHFPPNFYLLRDSAATPRKAA